MTVSQLDFTVDSARVATSRDVVDKTQGALTDEALNALALDSVKALVASMNVAQSIFARQFAALHLDDDLTMCAGILARVVTKLEKAPNLATR